MKTVNKVFGATCLVAGTTIGASMLALPMTSRHIGFYNSIWILSFMWAFMLLSAFVTVELSKGKGQSIATLCGTHLGRTAKSVAAGTLMVLFWALLAAYIAGASSILHQQFPMINQRILALYYGLAFITLVVWKTYALDIANRLLMGIKLFCFTLMAVILFPLVTLTNLEMSTLHSNVFQESSFYQALPIFFAAFGFHGSIPAIINYLEGDKRQIFKSLFIGSLVPLVIYILWQAMTLGILDASFDIAETQKNNVGVFVDTVAKNSQNIWILTCIRIFTFIAITTSFLGVGIGMFEYAREWFPKKVCSEERQRCLSSFKCIAFTFLIPLLFALFYPQGFVYALGFASMALSLLAVILPTLIGFKVTQINNGQCSIKKPFVMRIGVLLFLFLGGICIILIEGLQK